MGELHLEILVDRMRREFKVEANVGKPQVAYRETLRKAVARHDYTHKKQTGGSGQFAKIHVIYLSLVNFYVTYLYIFKSITKNLLNFPKNTLLSNQLFFMPFFNNLNLNFSKFRISIHEY